MSAVHERRLLKAAASPTLARMTNDAESLKPVATKCMLEYMRDHLFERRLTVERTKKACGVRDNSITFQFHRLLGRSPGSYLTEARMEVSRRLLSQTDLKIWSISDLLGFSTVQVFSRSFQRHHGIRPSRFRREAVSSGTPAVAVTSFVAMKNLQRVLSGEASAEDAREVISIISELYDL